MVTTIVTCDKCGIEMCAKSTDEARMNVQLRANGLCCDEVRIRFLKIRFLKFGDVLYETAFKQDLCDNCKDKLIEAVKEFFGNNYMAEEIK